jgi:hypothetical protein
MCGTIIGGPLSTQLSQQIAFAADFVKKDIPSEFGIINDLTKLNRDWFSLYFLFTYRLHFHSKMDLL